MTVDLSAPLSSFMDRLDAVALRVVARAGAELTGRQVARLAGTRTPANIRLSLRRLVDIGLVASAPAPHATMYSANRSHILWPAVEIAMNALNRSIASFADANGPEGVTVVLYGSVARGDATTMSDIDLLVVFLDTVTVDDRDEFVTGLRGSVQLWTGNDTQIYDVTESALARQREAGDPIVDCWATDGVVVFGDSVPGLRTVP